MLGLLSHPTALILTPAVRIYCLPVWISLEFCGFILLSTNFVTAELSTSCVVKFLYIDQNVAKINGILARGLRGTLHVAKTVLCIYMYDYFKICVNAIMSWICIKTMPYATVAYC